MAAFLAQGSAASAPGNDWEGRNGIGNQGGLVTWVDASILNYERTVCLNMPDAAVGCLFGGLRTVHGP
eukprot:2135504-Amphidinium_carterae.1